MIDTVNRDERNLLKSYISYKATRFVIGLFADDYQQTHYFSFLDRPFTFRPGVSMSLILE